MLWLLLLQFASTEREGLICSIVASNQGSSTCPLMLSIGSVEMSCVGFVIGGSFPSPWWWYNSRSSQSLEFKWNKNKCLKESTLKYKQTQFVSELFIYRRSLPSCHHPAPGGHASAHLWHHPTLSDIITTLWLYWLQQPTVTTVVTVKLYSSKIKTHFWLQTNKKDRGGGAWWSVREKGRVAVFGPM